MAQTTSTRQAGQPWWDVLVIVLTLLTDAFAVAAAYWLAFRLRALAPNNLESAEFYWGLAQFSGLGTLLVFTASGLYRAPGYQSRFDETVKAIFGISAAFTLVIAGAFFFREASFSRLVVLYAWGIAAGIAVSARLGIQQFNRHLRGLGLGMRPVLVLGTGPSAQALCRLLADNPQWGLRLAGLVAEDPASARCEPRCVAQLHELSAYLAASPVAEVWFAIPDCPRPQLLSLLQVVTAQRSVQVRLVPDILEYVTARMRVDVLGGTALLTLQDTPLRHWYNRSWKRLFDVVVAGGALSLGAPLLFALALAVRFTSAGPVLYRQERIGRDGTPFWIYKFRTMRADAEAAGPGWTTRGDPRRTRLGAFLRRTSLDELPQLWNVLVGDMSLVGPRPERPVYVERFSQDIPKYLDRHLVKTGITGWAQIHGLRGDTSIAERVRYDLYYIENWSLLLDLRIVLATAWQVLRYPQDVY